MFTSIRSIYGALGVALFLIAMFLVLNNGTSASRIIRALGGVTNDTFRTLQGRNA